ncbi:MAG: NfeD family protein [Clostridia bacterium]|nr:NfeD family protein [Clostridia bacterium]
MWQFWLIVAGVFLIGEIFTAGFLIFWLGIAAVLSMLVSIFTDNLIVQASVFVIASGLLIFFTKPFVDKYITKNQKSVKTNAFSVIGKKGIVTKEMSSTSKFGQVKVDEEIWTAVSEDSKPIPEGTEIEVVKIDGVKLVVKPAVIVIAK